MASVDLKVHDLRSAVTPLKMGVPDVRSTVMPAEPVPACSKRGTDIQNLQSAVMPAQAGIQERVTEHWIPASAGMTATEAQCEAERRAADREYVAVLKEQEYTRNPHSVVMPAQAGIQDFATKDWIPACAGMTATERRRNAERLAADQEDVATLEEVERNLEDKARGKKK